MHSWLKRPIQTQQCLNCLQPSEELGKRIQPASQPAQPRNRRQRAAPASPGPWHPLLHLRECPGLCAPPSSCGWASGRISTQTVRAVARWSARRPPDGGPRAPLFTQEWADARFLSKSFQGNFEVFSQRTTSIFLWKDKTVVNTANNQSRQAFLVHSQGCFCKHLIYNNKFWLIWKATSSASGEKIWS